MRNQPSRGPRLTPKRVDEKRPYGDGKNHEMMNTKPANPSAPSSSVSYVGVAGVPVHRAQYKGYFELDRSCCVSGAEAICA